MCDYKHICKMTNHPGCDPIRNGNGCGLKTLSLGHQTGQAEASSLSGLLGPEHKGMRVSASGLLGRIRDKWKVEDHQRYVAGELLRHLEELAERFYGGDVKAVDEFLQLYDLDDNRP